MRALFLSILMICGFAHGESSIISGASPAVQQNIRWGDGGLAGSRIIVLSTGYKRDSGASVVTSDSCSVPVPLASQGFVSQPVYPNNYCELRYQQYGDTTAKSSIILRLYSRYTDGSDTLWATGNMKDDTVPVVDTMRVIKPTNTYVSKSKSFTPRGAWFKVCAEKVTIPTGDTLIIRYPRLRCF